MSCELTYIGTSHQRFSPHTHTTTMTQSTDNARRFEFVENLDPQKGPLVVEGMLLGYFSHRDTWLEIPTCRDCGSNTAEYWKVGPKNPRDRSTHLMYCKECYVTANIERKRRAERRRKQKIIHSRRFAVNSIREYASVVAAKSASLRSTTTSCRAARAARRAARPYRYRHCTSEESLKDAVETDLGPPLEGFAIWFAQGCPMDISHIDDGKSLSFT